jgi:hypothetical protein
MRTAAHDIHAPLVPAALMAALAAAPARADYGRHHRPSARSTAVVNFELSEDAAVKLRMRRVGHGGKRLVRPRGAAG